MFFVAVLYTAVVSGDCDTVSKTRLVKTFFSCLLLACRIRALSFVFEKGMPGLRIRIGVFIGLFSNSVALMAGRYASSGRRMDGWLDSFWGNVVLPFFLPSFLIILSFYHV